MFFLRKFRLFMHSSMKEKDGVFLTSTKLVQKVRSQLQDTNEGHPQREIEVYSDICILVLDMLDTIIRWFSIYQFITQCSIESSIIALFSDYYWCSLLIMTQNNFISNYTVFISVWSILYKTYHNCSIHFTLYTLGRLFLMKNNPFGLFCKY